MHLYLRLMRFLPEQGSVPIIAEDLKCCLEAILEIHSVDSISEHPKGGLAVVLQVSEGTINAICDILEFEGYRTML